MSFNIYLCTRIEVVHKALFDFAQNSQTLNLHSFEYQEHTGQSFSVIDHEDFDIFIFDAGTFDNKTFDFFNNVNFTEKKGLLVIALIDHEVLNRLASMEYHHKNILFEETLSASPVWIEHYLAKLVVRLKWERISTTTIYRNAIIRNIVFEPEYYEAGISILNYFSTYVRKRYPQKEVKVVMGGQGDAL